MGLFRWLGSYRRSRWFEGSCEIHSYELDELLGTKLRALYQRRAGRDLFDPAVALSSGKVDAARIVTAFLQYMEHGRHTITRALFEKHMAEMMRDPEFLADISPLLSTVPRCGSLQRSREGWFVPVDYCGQM